MEGLIGEHSLRTATGVVIHSIPRHDGNGSFYMHFGDQGITMVICGFCLKLYDTASMTVEQCAQYMYRHWVNGGKGKSRREVHPLSGRPSEEELRQALLPHLSNQGNVGQSAKGRNAYLDLDEIVSRFDNEAKDLQRARQLLKEESIHVCDHCLFEPKTKRIQCCGNARLIEAKAWKREGGHSEPIIMWSPNIPTPVIQRSLLSNLVLPPPPPPLLATPDLSTATFGMPPIGLVSSSVQGHAMLWHNARSSMGMVTPASRRPHSMEFTTPASSTPQSEFHPYPSPVPWNSSAFETPVVSRSMDANRAQATLADGSTITVGHSQQQNGRLMISVTKVNQPILQHGNIFDASQRTSSSQGKKSKMLQDGSINSIQAINQLLCDELQYLEEEEQLCMAALHSLDPHSVRDNILLEASEIYLMDQVPYCCGILGKGVLLGAASQAPALASVVPLSQEDSSSGSYLREFHCADSTARRRIPVLASLLKLVISEKVPIQHERLNQGIDDVNKQLQTGGTVDTANFKMLVCNLTQVLIDLTFDKTGLIKRLLPPFAYRMIGPHDREGGNEDSDDDEDNILQGEHDTNSSLGAALRTKPLTPSVANQIFKGLIHIGKSACVSELTSYSDELDRMCAWFSAQTTRLESARDYALMDPTLAIEEVERELARVCDAYIAMGKSYNPLVRLSGALHGSTTLPDLATMKAKAARIEEENPSKESKWKQEPSDDYGPRLSIGSNHVDGAKLHACGSIVSQELSDILQDILSCGDAARTKDLVDMVLFPPDTDQDMLSFTFSHGGSRLTIKESTKFSQFQSAFSRRVQEEPERVLGTLERLRGVLYGCVYMFSSGTPRTADVRLFNLGSMTSDAAQDTGNVYGYELPDGRIALLVGTIIQKTLMEGVLIIPPFIARVYVLYLRYLAPVCLRQVVLKKAIASIPDEDARNSLSAQREQFSKCLEEHVSRRLSYKLKFADAFLCKLRELKGAVQVLDVSSLPAIANSDGLVIFKVNHGEPLLSYDSIEDVRIILRRTLCSWLDVDINMRQVRSLFVAIRNESPEYAKAITETGTPEMKKRGERLLELVRKVGEQWMQAHGTASSGHHSLLTMIKSYSAGVFFGPESRRLRVPELKLQTSAMLVDVMEMILGLYVERGAHPHRAGLAATMCSRRSLLDLFNESRLWADAHKDSLSSTIFAKSPNGCPKKPINSFQSAVVDTVLGLKHEDVLVVAGCGSGKTLGVTLPFAMAPGARIVFVITPLRCLLETMTLQLRDYGFDASEFDRTIARFKCESFTDGTRSVQSAKTEFVLCVTDALLNADITRFLSTAKHAGLLHAIIIDEVHQVIVSSSFRPAMDRVFVLRSLGVPLIMLSGTCPEAFESSVLSALKSSKASCRILRSKEDPTFERRIVNLVKVKTPDAAAIEIVQARRTGRTMVFCLTKQQSRQIKKALDARAWRDLDIMQLDSDATPEQRTLVLKRVTAYEKDDRNLVVCCTKLLAEGVDAAGFNTIIVVGGAHAGITDVVQMFGRGGRGNDDQRVEVFLLYNERFVRDVMYNGSQELMDRSDADNISAFIPVDQAGARPIVTLEGLGALFTHPLDSVCGRLALRYGMGEKNALTSLAKCGKCDRCAREAWTWTPVLKSMIIAETSVDKENDVPSRAPSGKVVAPEPCHSQTQAMVPLTDQQQNRLQTEPRPSHRDMTSVIQRLQTLAEICIVCRQKNHYPNECKTLLSACFPISSISKDACRNCFCKGHTAKEAGDRLKESSQGSKADVVATKRKDALVNGCAFVYKEHACYVRFQPCTTCWLQHDAREKGGSCPTTRYTVRACFLLVWHVPKNRKEFLELMYKSGALPASRNLSAWSEFMQWGVYEGGTDLQNAYRVVAFVLGPK